MWGRVVDPSSESETRHVAKSEPHEHRFGFQADSPNLFYSLLDLFFQGKNIGCRRPAPVHDRQGMLVRDAHVPLDVSLVKPGALDEPRRGNFSLRFQRRISGNIETVCSGPLGEIRELLAGEHGILEE